MTVIRCSNWSAVAKISRCCSPRRGMRMKAPWRWRSSSLGGFLAVLVQRVRPAPGDPGQEVGVVLDRRPGEGMLHPGGVLGVGDVPDPVQGKGDDGRGP